jgi:hypothetical protein
VNSRLGPITFAGCIAFIVALCGVPAGAETQSDRNLNRTAEAAWSNCPAQPTFNGELCNYAAVFAARGDHFQPFIIIQLVNLRVYSNGTAEVVAAGSGYVQPAELVTVTTTLKAASARGAANLYGNCGDPNNLATCAFLGVAAVAINWASSGQPTKWSEKKEIAEAERRSVFNTKGRTRSASASGAAAFRGAQWFLGSLLSARTSRIDIRQGLTCPGACAVVAGAAAAALPTPEALLKAGPVLDDGQDPDPDAARNPPLQDLRNEGSRGAADGQALGASALSFNPFDFSPLGQVRSLLGATGYLGGPALSGLNSFVSDLLVSYAASGRSFGFYPQAFNNDAYWRATSFNTSGLFYRFL